MTNDQTVTQADERLWCLHHIGPDEVHPAPDFATAQKWADWANHRFYDHAEISRFVVALWPWSADRHAEGLAQSIADWTLPPQSSVREEADVLLNTMRGWSDSQFASAATGEYCEDLKAKIEGVLSRILDRLSNERQAECDFSNAVWSALKGDHNDLRRQALILRAYRTAHSGEGRSNGAIEAAFREGHARGCIDGSGFEDRDWQRSDARKALLSTPRSNGAGEDRNDVEPLLDGCDSPEPSLREIVRRYYSKHFDPRRADELTDNYFAALAQPEAGGEHE